MRGAGWGRRGRFGLGRILGLQKLGVMCSMRSDLLLLNSRSDGCQRCLGLPTCLEHIIEPTGSQELRPADNQT